MRVGLKYLLLCFVVILVSCGTSNTESAFYIKSVSPENNSLNAFLVPTIRAVFSKSVDEDTINSDAFIILDEDGNKLNALVYYDVDNKTASLIPSTALIKDSIYYVEIDKSVADVDGLELDESYSWEFRTDGFYFVVISDTHVRVPGEKDNGDYNNQLNVDNLEAVVATINEKYSNADFVVVTGDLVGCLFSTDLDDYGEGKSNPANLFKTIMDDLKIPYYALLGNHDYQIDYDVSSHEGVMADDAEIPLVELVWEKVLNIEPYYSFLHEDINFIFLNSNKGSQRHVVCSGEKVEAMCTGSFDDEQMEWFEDELSSGKKTFIFTRHPIYTEDTIPGDWSYVGDSFMVWNEDEFYNVMDKYYENILAGFVGHGHFQVAGHYLNELTPIYETGASGDYLNSDSNLRLVSVLPETKEINVIYYAHDEEGED